MHREIYRQGYALLLTVYFFGFLGADLAAQNCWCPVISSSTLQTSNCNLLNNGSCTVCPGSALTFGIELADKLPNGGSIRWYSDTDPNFNPENGEGTLRQVHVLPTVTCNLASQVKINEFQPIPLIGDNNLADSTTGEWVELIGPPGANLGCYILTDGDWTITIPPGTVVPPSGLFVIGYSKYGDVDLDVATCNCSNSGVPNETLILDNQGEYLVLWNGFNYVDAVRYGNPILSNNPPFGTLVTFGAIPTAALGGCSFQIPIAFPMFTLMNMLPIPDYTYEREPDMLGPWKLENCGSRGRCNVDFGVGLPFNWTYNVPASDCGTTLYFKAIIDPLPFGCSSGPNFAAAGPFAVTVYCPETDYVATLCPNDSVIINGQTYNQQNPSGTEVLTSFIGCDSLVHVDLSFHQQVASTFSPDTTICIGDSMTLQFGLTGLPPFLFTIGTNGVPGPFLNTSQNTYSLVVKPADTTIYNLTFLQDDNGCAGTISDFIEVAVNAPTATLSLLETLICAGDSTTLMVDFTGGSPFALTWAAGLDTMTTTTGNPFQIFVSPGDTTAYTLISAFDHRGCPAAIISNQATLNTTNPVQISTLDFLCAPDMSSYTIELGLSEGIPSGYTIGGTAGSFAGALWTSVVLPNNTPYQLIVGDGGPCPADTLSGLIDCNCTTDPGLLTFQDTLRICPGQSTDATFVAQPVFETTDTLLFVLYADPLFPAGSILAQSPSPTFTYQNGWPLGQVLWLSAAVGEKSGTGFNLSDPCLKFSVPIPVIFYENPTAQFVLPPVLCGDDCVDVTVSIQGASPATLNVSWGDPANPQVFTNTSAGNMFSVPLCGDVFSGDYLFRIDLIADKYCQLNPGTSATLLHKQPVTYSYTNPLCAGDSILLHGVWFHDNHLSDTFSLANPAADGCDTIIFVALQHIPLAQGLLQKLACTGTTVQVGSTLFTEANPSGQVILPGAAATGCDSLVIVDLTFTTYVESFLNRLLCAGDTLVVHGESFYEGKSTGTITLPGASQHGCDSLIQVNVSFHTDLQLSLSGGGVYCPGDTVYLDLSGTPLAFNLELSSATGGSVSFVGIVPGQPFGFVPTVGGVYALSNANHPGLNCPVDLSGQAIIDIEVLSVGIQATSNYNGAVISCAGLADGAIMAAPIGLSATYNFKWENGSASNVRSGLPAGLYAVTVTSESGCTARSEFQLTDPAPLAFTARIKDIACADGAISLLTLSGGTGIRSWSIDGVTWTPLPGTPPLPELTPAPGPVMLSIRDENGCEADTTLVVPDGGPGIFISAFPDTTIYLGQPVQLGFTSSIQPANIFWSPGTSLSCSSCVDPVAKPTGPTEYEVTITDAEGCMASARVMIVTIDDSDFVYIPNVFSPNGDGINDAFIPFGDDLTYYVESGAVYDRWGNALWELGGALPGDLDQGWDGTSRGKPLENGVYVYYFRVRNIVTGDAKTFKGDILLMR
jgi:gliding motility-associated-like protein